MKRTIAVLCVSALIVLSGSALAQAAPIPTTIQSVGSTEGPPGRLGFYGFLQTTKKCRGDRVVKMLFNFGSGFQEVDRDKSSRAGNWGVSGDPTGATALRLTVLGKKYGRPGHRHTCQGDTITES